MTEKDFLLAVTDVIRNNSAIEGEPDDSLTFDGVVDVIASDKKIEVFFENGEKRVLQLVG